MQLTSTSHQLELPERMRSKLEAYRRRVWIVKLAEGFLAAAFGLLVSYVLVFVMDRIWDTPGWLRAVFLLGGALGFGVWFPLKWHRWVWRTRQLQQAARLLRRRFPRIGDQLLGIVELVNNEFEQERSESLCRAAMRKVDEEISDYDFRDAVPDPRHRRWAWAVGVVLAIVLTALIAVPLAGTNAFVRWLMPWRQIERYTFVQMGSLPDKIVVPYAEPFALNATLAQQTAWAPRHAVARYGEQAPIRADLLDGGYTFSLPPQKEPGALKVTVGDASDGVWVNPTPRPELTSIIGRVDLPDYLEYSTRLEKDVRGGSISLVRGSRFAIEACATRELAEAYMNGNRLQVQRERIVVPSIDVTESVVCRFSWQDRLGLRAKDPFDVAVSLVDDEPPMISCGKLRREQVVLSTDVLSFEVSAQDDFGVKSIGMEWVGIRDPVRNPNPGTGETLVAVGTPESRAMQVAATFSSEREGIQPQSLELRLYAIDYKPGRERVFSPVYILHVLSPQEHAIWLTHQLRKWFRQSQEVYEREQQLFEVNKALRDLSPEAVDLPENRRRIERQASAEQANARRLGALTGAGEQLIKQAVRNDQFNVATLENWSEMLQALKDIAENRMPTVADLLKDAASAPGSQVQPPKEPTTSSKSAPQVSVNRDGRSGSAKPSDSKKASKMPSISDVESGFNDLDQNVAESEAKPGPGQLRLPATTVQGGGSKQDGQEQTCPASDKVDQAVEEQEDLLAEFAKIADELKKILGNLEGSTFVKRLKAASRRQMDVASDLNGILSASFGLSEYGLDESGRERAKKIGAREVAYGDNVYIIQEDLDAYFDRVGEGKFKTVSNEMKSTNVVTNLHDIANAITSNLNGQSIAQTEFWADTLDRWAEQLVGPG